MKKSGFSLIELIIVIGIIALLTGIIINSINPSKSKSRDSKRVSDMVNLRLVLEFFFDRCKQYPPNITDLNTSSANGTCPSKLGTYISTIPTQPDGSPYGYAVDTDGLAGSGGYGDYVLYVTLENPLEVVKDGLPQNPNIGYGTYVPEGVNCSNVPANKIYCLGPK